MVDISSLHPIADSENEHSTRVSNYRQYFDELNIEGFDFSNGFRCSDVHKLGKLNNLFINKFELTFCQDQNTIWKHKLLPIEISNNDSDKTIGLVTYKNYYVLIKKLNVFLGNHNCNYVCRK